MTADLIIVDDEEERAASLQTLMERAGLQVVIYNSPFLFVQQFSLDEGRCVLLELNMREMSGLEVQDHIRQRGATIPVILTADANAENVPLAVKAVKAGAFEFLQKPVVATRILGSVQRALALARRYDDLVIRRMKLENRFGTLTSRERHVFKLVVDGASNKKMSKDLTLSEKTVEIHRGRVMRKMGARSIVQLVNIDYMLRGAVIDRVSVTSNVDLHVLDWRAGLEEHAIFTLDRNGSITQWSDSAHRVLGYYAKEVVGKNFSILFTQEDVDSGAPNRELLRAELHGLSSRNSWRIHRTGKKMWMNGIASALRDKSDRLVGFVRISRDLSELGTAAKLMPVDLN